MTNFFQKIIHDDDITCVNVAERVSHRNTLYKKKLPLCYILIKINLLSTSFQFMCVGTTQGRVFILDHDGNAVETACDSYPDHVLSVNAISIDSKGEFIASCSDDGKVFCFELCTKESSQLLHLNKQIKSIDLDPMFYKPGFGRRFITGDDRLVMYEKSFLKSLKSTELSEADGFVTAIKWNNNFVAWSSSKIGVRVYDLNEKCSLGLLKWEEPKEGRLSDYRCHLRWHESRTLLVGWVDTIRICIIRKRNAIEASSRNEPGFIVDPISSFKIDFIVCGLAPLESNQLVVLGFPKPATTVTNDEEIDKAKRPVLCAIEYEANDYSIICMDTLTIYGYDKYSHINYHLDYLDSTVPQERQYFIVSPKDIVVVSLLSSDDRIEWLIEHG